MRIKEVITAVCLFMLPFSALADYEPNTAIKLENAVACTNAGSASHLYNSFEYSDEWEAALQVYSQMGQCVFVGHADFFISNITESSYKANSETKDIMKTYLLEGYDQSRNKWYVLDADHSDIVEGS